MPHQKRDQSFNTFVDGQCDQLEQAWKSGVTPDLRQFLIPQETSSRRELLQHLILVDCWYRRESGILLAILSGTAAAGIAASGICGAAEGRGKAVGWLGINGPWS